MRDAVLAWLNPKSAVVLGKTVTLPNKPVWMAQDRFPTPDEEATLRTIPEAASIPSEEWGAVCALWENMRRSRAEESLAAEASQQIDDGLKMLDYTEDHYLHWPWPAMDAVVGGMAPGTLHYVVCPSKGGKTTLCRTAASHWVHEGKRVYYAGLEMTAKLLRMMYAADDCGVDPGDVVTGAWLQRPDVDVLRDQLRAAWLEQDAPSSPYRNLKFAPFQSVDRTVAREMMQVAADWGADVVIVDHVDHVDGSKSGSGDYQGMKETQHLFLNLAQTHNMKVILTSQMNTTGKSQDLWRDHRPLRMEHVKYGALKLEVATTMVGMYRPVRVGLTKEEKQSVEAGERSVFDMLEVGVNAVNVLASRPYGSRIGNRAYVGWDRGRIVDAPQSVLASIEARKHAIKTNSNY